MKKIYLSCLVMLVVLLASWATTAVVMQQDDATDFTSRITNPNLDDGLNGWTQVTASGQAILFTRVIKVCLSFIRFSRTYRQVHIP